MDKTILFKLGLKDKEIEIYLFLNKTGVQTVKQISAATGINRTTTYRYLEALREKGLVEWIIDERGTKVKSTGVDNLNILLKSQRKKFEEVKNDLPPFISQLQLLKPIEKFATQVRYYQGEKGIEQIIWNTLKAKEVMRSYAALRRREFIDNGFENEFEARWAESGLKDKVITNEGRLDYIKNKLVAAYRQNLEIRLIPDNQFCLTNDIAIYNNTLAIISLEKDNLVGVEIENEEIAKTQKSIFDIVWEQANLTKIKPVFPRRPNRIHPRNPSL